MEKREKIQQFANVIQILKLHDCRTAFGQVIFTLQFTLQKLSVHFRHQSPILTVYKTLRARPLTPVYSSCINH